MNHLLEILKIIEASSRLDRIKVAAYARQLAKKLEQEGEVKASERIINTLNSAEGAGVQLLGASSQERVPVDGESRLGLADETFPSDSEVAVYLPPQVMSVVDEFLRHLRGADKLLAEGLSVAATMLLHGPPGCGKTELARLIAARLGLPLLTARSDTLISSYLGSTSKNLRLLFDHAARRPCVLFLDEFDAVAKLRDDRHELGELKRVVVSLLQNIDAVKHQTVLLAATNHEHLLDPAIWRRFAYRVKIELPGLDERISMLQRFIGRPFDGKSIERLAILSDSISGSDIREMCEASLRSAILDDMDAPLEVDIIQRIASRRLGSELRSPSDIIVWIKNSYPKLFSHQALADMYHMSKGNITHILQRHRRSIDIQMEPTHE